MKKFPIKIDLSIFFEDERKFVIILVDPQWKSVECLQHRVEEIFDVKPVRFLTTDNLFIPQQESIEVLEFTESIKAFIPKHVLEKSRRRSKQYQQEKNKIQDFDGNTELLPIEEAPIKKRKYYSLGMDILGSSTPNQSKKSKRAPVSTEPVSNGSQEITSTNEQAIFLEGCSLTNASNGNITISDKTENESESTGDKPRVKRKKRKQKGHSGRNVNIDQEKNETVGSVKMSAEIPSSTFLNKSKSLENNSHIYFEDSTIVESTTVKHKAKNNTKATLEETISSNVVFQCKLNEMDFREPLIHPIQTINKKQKTRKPIINIQEHIIIRPADMQVDFLTEGMNNIENCVDKSPKGGEDSINIENVQSDLNIARRLEDGKSEIGTENVSQVENSKEETDFSSTVNDGQENHKVKIKDPNEINANHSKVELSTNECINEIEEVTISPEVKIEENVPSIKNNNCTDISDTSIALDGTSVIDLDDDEDVINLSDAEDQQHSIANPDTAMLSDSLNKSINSMSIKEMLPFCIPPFGFPDLGDIVIFKFNRGGFGTKFELSELVACKCEHINKRTKVLKLAIIDASRENDIIPQKYSYQLDESLGNRFMNIKLNEMFETKVLKS